MSEKFQHPELQEGEAFLGDVVASEVGLLTGYHPYTTLRVGSTSYNLDNQEAIDGFVPVFVSKEELERFGRYIIPHAEVNEMVRKLKEGKCVTFRIADDVAEEVFAAIAARYNVSLHRYRVGAHTFNVVSCSPRT